MSKSHSTAFLSDTRDQNLQPNTTNTSRSVLKIGRLRAPGEKAKACRNIPAKKGGEEKKTLQFSSGP